MKNLNLLEEILTLDLSLEECRQQVRQFMLTNVDLKSVKLDPFNFVDNDKLRPVQHGVHYKDGYAVATNGHSLLMMRQKYPPELEGKVINKKGEALPGAFPRYLEVLPDISKEAQPISIDVSSLRDVVKALRLDKKAKIEGYSVGVINGSFYLLPNLEKLLTVVENFEDLEVYLLPDPKFWVVCTNWVEEWFLCLPMVPNENTTVAKQYKILCGLK